jgi:hypothetical protein
MGLGRYINAPTAPRFVIVAVADEYPRHDGRPPLLPGMLLCWRILGRRIGFGKWAWVH